MIWCASVWGPSGWEKMERSMVVRGAQGRVWVVTGGGTKGGRVGLGFGFEAAPGVDMDV